jgi:hypothetical protein
MTRMPSSAWLIFSLLTARYRSRFRHARLAQGAKEVALSS